MCVKGTLVVNLDAGVFGTVCYLDGLHVGGIRGERIYVRGVGDVHVQ